MGEEQRLLLRPVEVAERIGTSRSRAYELIHSGVIPSIRIGASIRVPVAALKAWVDQQLEAATAERTQR